MGRLTVPQHHPVAVVTGASRGIGEAVATQLAERGYRVALIARDHRRLIEVAKEINTLGGHAEIFACDLVSELEIRRTFDDIITTWQRIDVLINAAGVGGFGPYHQVTDHEITTTIRVPLLAAMLTSRRALDSMLAQGHGQIVNIVSPTAYFDLPHMAAYTTARAGLISFSRALDEEYGARGVRTKTVCPAWVETDYLAANRADPDWMPRIAKVFPRHTPREIADLVLHALDSTKRTHTASRLIDVFASCHRHFPRLSTWLLKRLNLFQAPNASRSTNWFGSPRWTNWEESIDLEAAEVAMPRNLEELREIVTDTARYPSPVRAAGSRHTTTHCGVTDGGTLLVMREMRRIKRIDADNMTVTVEAGAHYKDVANALEHAGLQFYVNVEIGNLTMGSAACTGTKDASMPGEYGQVCSYCCGVKMVKADGELVTVDESDNEMLQALRSSYGLLGVIYEVTFKVRRLQAMEVFHRNYTLDQFLEKLPELRNGDCSMMYYLFPFQDRITVEFRRYALGYPLAKAESLKRRRNRIVWRLRNMAWKLVAPTLGHLATKYVSRHSLRYAIVDGFGRFLQWFAATFLRSNNTWAGDQIIAYPEHKNIAKYTFSIWAFPEQHIATTMRAYFDFCKAYYRQHGFRCDLLNVGYRIKKDQRPLFSYSFDGDVMTLDPVTTGAPGWDDFLRAYNEFCSEHNGVPLFNQTKWLTCDQVQKAFAGRIDGFWSLRRHWDPEDRLVNTYFCELFAPEKRSQSEERGRYRNVDNF